MSEETMVAEVTFYEPGTKKAFVPNEQGTVEELEMSASIRIGDESVYQYRLFQKYFDGEPFHAILKIYPDNEIEWVSEKEEAEFVNDILTKAAKDGIPLTESNVPITSLN